MAWIGAVPSIKELDALFPRVPPENDIMAQKLREEARAQLLERKNNDLLDNDELAVSKCVLKLLPNQLIERSLFFHLSSNWANF